MTRLNVCCALITLSSAHGPLLLAAKKACGQSNGLLYEFPGGKLEAGEDARDAIVREIREELGCAIRPLCPLAPVLHREKDRPYALSRFCANWRKAACPFPGARKLGILFQPFPPFPALGAGGPPHSEGMARPERPLMLRHRTPFPRRFLRSPGISATLFRFNSSSAWPGSFIRPMSEKGTKNILDNQPAWGIKGIGCCTRHHPAKWPEPILQHNGGSPGAGLTMSYTEKSKQRRKSPLY